MFSSINNSQEKLYQESLECLSKKNFKKDRYAKSRGESKMLAIRCNSCANYVMSYQKDGKGRLLRCYLDRIHYPPSLEGRVKLYSDTKTIPNLCCEVCKKVLAMPMVYEKEKRLAYRLVQGSVYTQDMKL